MHHYQILYILVINKWSDILNHGKLYQVKNLSKKCLKISYKSFGHHDWALWSVKQHILYTIKCLYSIFTNIHQVNNLRRETSAHSISSPPVTTMIPLTMASVHCEVHLLIQVNSRVTLKLLRMSTMAIQFS